MTAIIREGRKEGRKKKGGRRRHAAMASVSPDWGLLPLPL